jgi:hypothetical protein
MSGSEAIMPAWLCIVLAIVPYTLYLFVKPGEHSNKIVRAAHTFGAAWYVAVSIYTFFEFYLIGYSKEFIVYSFFILLGFPPSILIALKAIRKDRHEKIF